MSKKFLLIILIVSFVFSPLSFTNIFVFSQSFNDGYEHIIGYQEWHTDKNINNPIIIDNGATLVIKKGITVTFSGGVFDIRGNLITEGTIGENVKFRKGENYNNYSILVGTTGKLTMRNTDMSGGGASVNYVRSNVFLNAANAFYQGGIHINGGALDAEGCNFHDNDVAIFVANSSYEKIKVNRSKFTNNNILDVFLRGYYSKLPNFQFNWWGSANGPAKTCYASGRCYYDTIDGTIDSSNWLKAESFHDPVIIIPGIMGSVDFMDDKILMPIIYKRLYKTFEENGYIADKDLFKFPYEWRDSNVDNAKLLRDKINEIKQLTKWPKVDVVAHSMGGLLTREYIESAYYQNDIDQLVTLGTPQNGAPIDYLAWDGGEMKSSNADVIGVLLNKVFYQESKENGYDNLFDYIRNRPIKSVQELLPTYNYLWDTVQNNMRVYPSGYPINSFLENLNSQNKISKLRNVVFTNIIGNLNDDSNTVKKIRVGQISSPGSLWEHGYPENYDSLTGDQGLEWGRGDGTVPLESSTNISSYEQREINSSHVGLPANAADVVYETITGNMPDHPVDYVKIAGLLSLFVFSPIDIQIIAPDGKRVGKEFETGEILNEIEGSFYTGYKTNSEFLTIPNPIDGEYKILTQGTGDGSYRIEATKISENFDNFQSAVESTGVIEGIASTGQQEEKIIKISGNDVIASKPVTIETIVEDIVGYYDKGLIKKESEEKFLLNKMEGIMEEIVRMERWSERSKVPVLIAEQVKENFIAQINRKIDDLIRIIGNRDDSVIDSQVKADLTAKLNLVKF